MRPLSISYTPNEFCEQFIVKRAWRFLRQFGQPIAPSQPGVHHA